MKSAQRHILVTGPHRSGTTWVGKTVSKSHGIKYVHEPFNVGRSHKHVGLKLDTWFLYAPTSPQKEQIQKSFDGILSESRLKYAIHISKTQGVNFTSPLLFCKHLFLHPSRVLIKDPISLFSAGWLYDRYNLHVICMIRNPLAFAGSIKKAAWSFDFNHLLIQDELMQNRLSMFRDEIAEFAERPPNIVDQACLLWNIMHTVISHYQETYPDWLFMRHEDLASDPSEQFLKIFNHLGMAFSPTVREMIINYTNQDNPVDTDGTKLVPRNAIASLDTWKDRLSTSEIDRVIDKTQLLGSKFYGDIFY